MEGSQNDTRWIHGGDDGFAQLTMTTAEEERADDNNDTEWMILDFQAACDVGLTTGGSGDRPLQNIWEKNNKTWNFWVYDHTMTMT